MTLRETVFAIIFSLACANTVAAETMRVSRYHALRCTNEKALAALTAPDGSIKAAVDVIPSPAFDMFQKYCKDAPPGEEVELVARRRNTSIVTLAGERWYVPNIDYMTPGPDCIRSGTVQTLVGRIVDGTARVGGSDPGKVYHYPRLQLDKPVCFIGNLPRQNDAFVSMTGTNSRMQAMLKAAGRHVRITGTLDTPDIRKQPPDNMTMFDPVIQAAP